ncbi:hypothetical protein JHK82_048283 [Glycine max]|nr:hypothetical protein JHK82_048283 [Glycine max]
MKDVEEEPAGSKKTTGGRGCVGSKRRCETLKSLRNKAKKREGASMKGVSSNNMPRPSKEKIQELKGCEVKLVM